MDPLRRFQEVVDAEHADPAHHSDRGRLPVLPGAFLWPLALGLDHTTRGHVLGEIYDPIAFAPGERGPLSPVWVEELLGDFVEDIEQPFLLQLEPDRAAASNMTARHKMTGPRCNFSIGRDYPSSQELDLRGSPGGTSLGLEVLGDIVLVHVQLVETSRQPSSLPPGGSGGRLLARGHQ